MNILFALYHNLACNSACHVDGLARELIKLGHECVVAVPNMDAGGNLFGATPYRVVLYDEAVRLRSVGRLFQNGAGRRDMLHCWTPREKLRQFQERFTGEHAFTTVIHLEDNEWQLSKSFLGERAFALANYGKFPGPFPDGLTDPIAGKAFLAAAGGCTLLIESLGQLVPEGKPSATFWPAVDRTIFHPREANPALRREVGVPEGAAVFVYTGNVHAANFREVRSLYLAVHLLNRAGRPVRLIRLGNEDFDFPHGYREWAKTYAIPMGFLEDRRRVGEILGLADVLIQPGRPDPFNDLRFPSKLPEFFAMGKPVILPRTNIGLVARHLEDAFVLEDADGPHIAEAAARILDSAELQARLGAGALAFYDAHFSWERAARTVEQLYAAVLAGEGAA